MKKNLLIKSFALYLIIQLLNSLVEINIERGFSDLIIFICCIVQTIILYKYYLIIEDKFQLYFNKKQILISIFISIGFILTKEIYFYFIQDYINIINNNMKNLGMVTAIIIFYPIAEEFIMREVLLKLLSSKYTFLMANIIQAIIFGILHFDLYVLILYIFFGFILGYVRKKMDLYSCIFIHILCNTITFLSNI